VAAWAKLFTEAVENSVEERECNLQKRLSSASYRPLLRL
jgi:hypothetical protein